MQGPTSPAADCQAATGPRWVRVLWSSTTKYHLIKRYVRCLSSKQACETSRSYFNINLSHTVKLPSLLRMQIDQGLQLPAHCSSVLSAKKPSIHFADKRNDEVISLYGFSHDTFSRPSKRTARRRSDARRLLHSDCFDAADICFTKVTSRSFGRVVGKTRGTRTGEVTGRHDSASDASTREIFVQQLAAAKAA